MVRPVLPGLADRQVGAGLLGVGWVGRPLMAGAAVPSGFRYPAGLPRPGRQLTAGRVRAVLTLAGQRDGHEDYRDDHLD
jgi:hypothetical protein